MKKLVLIVLISGILQYASGQAQYVSFRIDSAIRAAMQERKIPGMQVLVSKFGLVLKKGHFGFANLENRVAVTDSTRFAIAAMSKAFTCAGILLLMEDGKLNIDDSISKYFDSLPAAWTGITLQRLMNHTAGLRDDWDSDDNYFLSHTSDSAFFAALKNAPLKFTPGEGFSYGCGPFILGMLIEKVSGQSYAEFMKYRVFDKLGMINTCINDPARIIPNRASGYIIKDQQILNGRRISAAAEGRGDIGVLTTVTDMLKWYNALQDSSLLKKSSLKLMFSPGRLNDSSQTAYGFGWFLNPYRDHAFISHRGGLRTGFNSVIEMYPEDHVVIIILCNRQSAKVGFLAKDIIGLFNKDYGRASLMERKEDLDSVRTMLHKHYFEYIGLDLDSGRGILRKIHYPEYLLNREALAPFRNFTEFNFISAIQPPKPQKDLYGDLIQTICLYEVKYADQPSRYYSFLLNENNQIVYIDYEE